MDDQLPSSPKPRCYPWKSSSKKQECDKIGAKDSGKNAYYGDYGMEDNIYGENGPFSMKEQNKLLKEALKDQERETNKMAKKKGFNLAMEGPGPGK